MNTATKSHRSVSPVPGFGTVFLIALVFIGPLMVWGDRFPWLVAFPVAAIVFITARSEWARMRKPSVAEAPVKVEVTLVLTKEDIVTVDVADFFWQPASKSCPRKWMYSGQSEGRLIAPKKHCQDKPTPRHEDLLAVA